MEKLPEHKYKGHWTFWRYLKRNYNIDRPTKYCVIFNIWKDTLESFSCTEFDTLDDALYEAKELNKMYSSTPNPFKNYHENGKHRDGWGWRYDPFSNKISNESPIAKAVMGKKVNDKVTVESPNGSFDIEIVKVA